jgi:putative FmdB family regulatory protein
MPIYEFRCDDCGKISEFLLIKTDEAFIPQCKRCRSKRMSRVLSKVRVIRSEESMMRWAKRMGEEMGEDTEGMDEAMEEEMAAAQKPEREGGGMED